MVTNSCVCGLVFSNLGIRNSYVCGLDFLHLLVRLLVLLVLLVFYVWEFRVLTFGS